MKNNLCVKFWSGTSSSSSVALIAAALLTGCGGTDPALDNEFSELEYSVGMPVAVSADPGKLTNGPIDPPEVDLPSMGYHSVGMRLREKPVPPPAATEANPVENSNDDGDATVTASASLTTDNFSIPGTEMDSARIAAAPVPVAEHDASESLDTAGAPDVSSDDVSSNARPSDQATPFVGVPPKAEPPKAEPPKQLAAGMPVDHSSWPIPDLTLVVTGNQHGYLEPCGCTGLERQKGGVARRFTFLEQLRSTGWNLAPIDVGNQVRRFGAQAEIKLQQTVDALDKMGYEGVGIGPEDVRLGIGPMLAVAAGGPNDSLFCSANVVLFDDSMMEKFRMIDSGGMKVGVTSVLEPESIDAQVAEEITIAPAKESAAAALAGMNAANAQFRVAMYFGEEEKARQLMQEVSGFDLIVVSGGYGEPTYEPMTIDDSETKMIITGNKGMYAGLVGLYADKPMRYSRVALTHELKDAPEMRALMAEYQEQLKQVGFEGLGLMPPIPHSSGGRFVGSETCGKCHTSAMDVWENSMHAEATAHLVQPPAERGDVARHFDPECLSCHVTGWNAQDYFPFESGYLSLEQTAHLTGNGCENCHGPGAAHSAAEAEGSSVSEEKRDLLRLSMQLPLEKAREKCLQCHDLDNSPDFHDPDAFEEIYWPEIEHEGLD